VLKQDKVKAIARKLRVTAAQVALAWLLRKSPAMLPIPGTASIPHLEQNIAAANLALADADFEALG